MSPPWDGARLQAWTAHHSAVGKTKAKATLGTCFNPPAFHAAVLDSGALPLPIPERKIDGWISDQRAPISSEGRELA